MEGKGRRQGRREPNPRPFIIYESLMLSQCVSSKYTISLLSLSFPSLMILLSLLSFSIIICLLALLPFSEAVLDDRRNRELSFLPPRLG
jgi:hypothetical protein